MSVRRKSIFRRVELHLVNYRRICPFTDIDECSIMHGVCGDGECQNVPGSFVCKCKEGYETSQLMQVCMGNDIKNAKKIQQNAIIINV